MNERRAGGTLICRDFRTGGGYAMKPLVTDALWERLQPLLPPQPARRFRFPGRKPIDYRKALTGIAWDDLPAELGLGCGKTCRRYLKLWSAAARPVGAT
jgi:transposase